MKHLILGYGYCGFYLARKYLEQHQQVAGVAREPKEEYKLPGLQLIAKDIRKGLQMDLSDTVLYYLIPPPSEGQQDSTLRAFLQTNPKPKKVIYFGSSGVYGQHQGAWVDENSSCHISHDRQLRRLDAEQQWQNFCSSQDIPCTLLRVAGIYGPKRLPIEAAKRGLAVIEPKAAPFTNHIYVKDLIDIAIHLAHLESETGLFNVADGQPAPMGSLQRLVTEQLQLPPPPSQSYQQALQSASPMKREFLQASKRLSIKALQTTLDRSFNFTSMKKAIKESLDEQGELK